MRRTLESRDASAVIAEVSRLVADVEHSRWEETSTVGLSVLCDFSNELGLLA